MVRWLSWYMCNVNNPLMSQGGKKKPPWLEGDSSKFFGHLPCQESLSSCFLESPLRKVRVFDHMSVKNHYFHVSMEVHCERQDYTTSWRELRSVSGSQILIATASQRWFVRISDHSLFNTHNFFLIDIFLLCGLSISVYFTKSMVPLFVLENHRPTVRVNSSNK